MPKKLNDKHRMVSYLVAAGQTRSQVAEVTGFTPEYLTTLTRSPLFKRQLARIRQEVEDRAVGAIVDQLQERTVNEADGALDTMIELMNGARNENVRLGAATNILDRAVPKQTKHQEEQTIRISIDSEALQGMSAVVEELKQFAPETIDADFSVAPEKPLEGASDEFTGSVRLTSVDELAAEYEQLEHRIPEETH